MNGIGSGVTPQNTPVYRTRRYHALGHVFEVATESRVLRDYLNDLLAAMESDGGATSEYALLERENKLMLFLDDQCIGQADDVNGAVTRLLWHVNHEMIRCTEDAVLVHAAAAEHNGSAILLPAPMEAGKTTLVAGLVLAGFRYLTDEAVGILPTDLTVQPYPKPLSIDPGSWSILPGLEPSAVHGQDPARLKQWHVSPLSIRQDAVAPVARARLIIAPQYSPGTTTHLVRTSRAEMVTLLAECAFFQRIAPHAALAVLAEVVRQCDCFRLRVGELGSAVSAVQDACRKIVPPQ